MRYFIGGLIIKAKEYPQWKHFQYRQEGETQLIILEQDYIPLTNHGLIHSIDDIDIFKTDNRYELSYKGIAVMCISLEVKPIRLSVIKALSDEAAVEMVEKKIFPLIFYATDKAVPLHATMIQKGNIATAFLGASFSGKSTLAAYFISKHGYSLISDDILPIYTDSGKSYTYKMTSKLRLRRNSAEHIPTKETLMDVKPHSILVRKLFVINNSQNVFCHTNKNCLEALMKNLFAPYYCNFSTRFLNILSSISKTVDMYTLDYVKNYEALDQTCNIIKSIIDI